MILVIKMKCACRNKKRSEEEKKVLINRLNRLEGQIKGIKKMVEDDIYCADILNQSSAIASALKGFNVELLNQHLQTCVKHDLQQGNEESWEESLAIMRKLMK